MSQPLAVYLVTGSRDWSGDPDEVTGSMRDFAARHSGRDCILFHGDCRGVRSIDESALWRALHLGWLVRAFPAHWSRGRKAGPLRNAEMVAAAAHEKAMLCPVEVHAWPMPDSRGTWDCARKARAAGLPVIVHCTTEVPW